MNNYLEIYLMQIDYYLTYMLHFFRNFTVLKIVV